MKKKIATGAKVPTNTSRVMEFLTAGDDFYSLPAIAKALGITKHVTRVTLAHLRTHLCVWTRWSLVGCCTGAPHQRATAASE